MGIAKDVVGLVDIAARAIGKDKLDGIVMCELGNQHMRFGKYKTAKKYFKARGVDHTSVDRNGKDGAEKLDLNMPIDRWDDKFDIVTNYGTSEHVFNQGACFDNIHRFCRVGGAMVHAVPLVGKYIGHCHYHYDTEFFETLAKRFGYKIAMNKIRTRGKGKALVCAVLVKQ